MIKIENLCKVYVRGNQNITALDNISLTIKKGEIYGIIGESGAGKSTLIRCVNLLERPTSGKVFVDGIDLLSLSDKQLAKQRSEIGMIFQHFNLLQQRTVFDNVALSLELNGTKKSEIKNRVNKLLKIVKLENRANQYPIELSGGQKQRVAIARALATNPKVLLCDEATSALDPGTTEKILTLLKDINIEFGITILLITHEMGVVKTICDHVAVIDNGKLIEQGSVVDVFSSPKTELAAKFIEQTSNSKLPIPYLQALQCTPAPGLVPVVQLRFTGESVDAPLLSQISRDHNVDLLILESHIDFIHTTKFGYLVCELIGNEQQIESAISALNQHKVGIKTLGYLDQQQEVK